MTDSLPGDSHDDLPHDPAAHTLVGEPVEAEHDLDVVSFEEDDYDDEDVDLDPDLPMIGDEGEDES